MTQLRVALCIGVYMQYPKGFFHRKDEMTHTIPDKQKLLNRVRRLRGQVDAIERAMDSDEGCTEVLRLLTASRGAINAIMAEVVEDHIHMHMIDANRKPSRAETEAADELIDVLRSYIR
jgi:DNA-binding FrmR family transcriptional regulator